MITEELESLWKQRARECSHQPGMMYLSDHEKSLVESGYVQARRIAHLEHAEEIRRLKEVVQKYIDESVSMLDKIKIE